MTIKTLSLITTTLLLATQTFAEETLQDITVTSATKTSQSLKNITSNVDVITAAEIEDRGYSTVTQALNALAGISFTQNGGIGQSTSVSLRGMDTKRTLVLIDGVRYNDLTGLSGAPFAHLMIDDIAQIEVVKGAQSGIWGADASAGVINIITKKAATGSHGAFHAEKGSFNTEKHGVTLSQKTDKYSVKIAHNVTKTDGFSAQQPKGTDLDTLEDDGYKNTTTTFDLGYALNENNDITLSRTIIDAQGQYDPFGQPNGAADSTTYDTFTKFNMHHKDNFNEVNLYAKRSTFDRTFTAADYTGNVTTTPYAGSVNEYGITSKIPYATEDFVLLGAEYKDFKQGDVIQKDFNNKSLFLTSNTTLKNPLGGKLLLSSAVRYDDYSSFDSKTTFKIGLKNDCVLVDGLTIAANYGTAYNAPSLYQLFSPYGVETLNPESTKSWDVTVAYKDFSLSYFDTQIDDMIDFDMGTFKYNNIAGTSKISGLEAAYKTELFSNFLFSVNYTRLFKAEDQQGNDLIRRAKDDVKIAMDYYGITDLHLGVDAEYVGSRTDTKFNADYTTTNVETGKYTVVNMTADYNLNKELKLYGKIVNLTDEAYQTVYGYATSPRAFYAGIRAKF